LNRCPFMTAPRAPAFQQGCKRVPMHAV
jgi:hypothetical protein